MRANFGQMSFSYYCFLVLSLENAAHFVDQSELCGMYIGSSKRGAAPVLFPVFVLFFFFFLLAAQTRWISQFLRYIRYWATE